MAPVLRALVALTIRILFSLLFLRKVPLAVRYNLSHVVNVILVVFFRIFLRILLQNSNGLAATFVTSGFAAAVIFRPTGTN